jgi:hypothetical protein
VPFYHLAVLCTFNIFIGTRNDPLRFDSARPLLGKECDYLLWPFPFHSFTIIALSLYFLKVGELKNMQRGSHLFFFFKIVVNYKT